MYKCTICGKDSAVGNVITKRGMAKKDGGVGRRNVRVNRRRFIPNLQSAKLLLNGTVRRARVCTGCLRSGRAVKAPFRPKTVSA